jgi:large subunit ribosomal protein L29
MAKKKEDKKESLHAMSPDELSARIREAQDSKFRLLFRHAGSPLKNPMQIRETRRQIARLRTILHQKDKQAV